MMKLVAAMKETLGIHRLKILVFLSVKICKTFFCKFFFFFLFFNKLVFSGVLVVIILSNIYGSFFPNILFMSVWNLIHYVFSLFFFFRVQKLLLMQMLHVFEWRAFLLLFSVTINVVSYPIFPCATHFCCCWCYICSSDLFLCYLVWLIICDFGATIYQIWWRIVLFKSQKD